jgi:hypothetical protein
MDCVYGTGNNIVDQVGKIGLSGNIIPDAWYKTIISRNGKVNLLAVNILADVVYWYRPSEMRDEITGKVTYKKKFRHVDFLQKSYKDICEKFNCSEKQAREALKDLENLGVVTRHFKTVETEYGFYPNAMFLELIPGALIALTFPEDEKNDNDSGRGNTCCPTGKHTLPQKETGISEIGNTYTENNTEISTKTSTTSDADVSIVETVAEMFKEYSLPLSDIRSIIKEAGNDLAKCRIANDLLKQQKNKISNVTGWIINAIRKDYKFNPRASNPGTGSFFRFQQREDYDYDDLLRKIVAN